MKTLGTQWGTRKNRHRSKTGWALQIVQDTLAIQLAMPLRLYDVNIAKQVEHKLSKFRGKLDNEREYSEAETKRLLQSIKTDTELTGNFKSYHHSPWVTKASNNDMLIEKVSSWNIWRCFQNIIMSGAHEKYRDQINEVTVSVCDKLIYYFYHIRTNENDMNFILVSGPRINIPCNEATCNFADTEKFIERFGAVLSDSQAPSWVKPDRTDLAILCRTVNETEQIKKQLALAGKSIKKLLDISIATVEKDIVIERKTIMQLAMYAFKHISSGEKVFEKDLAIPLNQRKDHNIQLHIAKSGGQWKIIRAKHQSSCDKFSVMEKTAEAVLFEQNRIFYFHQRLKLFRSWIDYHFGIIAAEHTVEAGNSTDPIVNKLASQIADLLLAETVSIFRYDYHTETLFALALHYKGGDGVKGATSWKETQIEIMTQAGKDLEKRAESISYRVKDKQKDCLCYFYDHQNGKADPADETLLSAGSDLYECPKSGMAVPISIHGRLFGVLEVSGLCEYQFGQVDLHYASLIADEIGRNLYQRHVWQYINYVIKETNTHADPRQKYNALCEAACKIFMAEATTLWQPDHSHQGCRPIGWFNRDDLIKICKNKNCKCGFDESGSPIGVVVDDLQNNPDDYYACSDIRTLIKNDPTNWDRDIVDKIKPQREWILDNEITSVVVIPLYPWEKREERGEYFQFILCLYYKEQDARRAEPLGSQWNPTVKFVAHNFGLHLETIKLENDIATLEDTLEQKINLQKRKGLIEHELKGQIPLVLEKATNILESIKKTQRGGYRIDRRKTFRFKEWLQDLETYKQDLHLMLGLFQDDKMLKKIPESGRLIFNLAELRGKKIIKKRINLRETFNNLYRATYHEQCRKRIKDDTALTGVIWPAVEIAEEHLTRILSNLISNTVKYALPNTTISVIGCFDRFQNFTLSFSNYTAPFKDKSDIYRLKLYSVRGSNNIENVDGKGLGLYLVDGFCSYNSIGFDIDYDTIEYNGKICGKFVANLIFSHDCIIIKTGTESSYEK